MPRSPRPARLTALGDELVRIHDSLRADLRRLQAGVCTPGRPLAVHCLAFCAALTRHHTQGRVKVRNGPADLRARRVIMLR